MAETKLATPIQRDISGLPIGGSAFVGTGLFERTDTVSAQLKLDGVSSRALIERQVAQQFQPLSFVQQPGLRLNQQSKIQLLQMTGLEQQQQQAQLLRQQQAQVRVLREATRERLVTRPRVITNIIQSFLQIPVTRPRVTTKTRTSFFPTITPIQKVTPTSSMSIIKTEGQFKVKVRKGGKDIKIGEETTLLAAKELLLTRLKTTLRASGFVERDEKRIDLGFLEEGFRRSKKEPKRVVEIRKKRIKRKEI